MAKIPNSVSLGGFIAPNDSADTYATHDEQYGRGGFRSVATTTERDAIPTDRRKEGMEVKVLADGKKYELVGGVNNSNWVEVFAGVDETQLNRLFKPTLGAAPAWENRDQAYMDMDIARLKLLGVETISFCVHVKIGDGVLYTTENLDHLDYAISKGLKIDLVKPHFAYSVAEIDAYGREKWKTDYKNLLESVMQIAQGKAKYFTVFNEVSWIYFNPDFKTFVIELFNLAKSYGFLTGVSTNRADTANMFATDNLWINEEIDCYFFNIYPVIGCNDKNTTLQDSVYAWNAYMTELKQLKQKGNGKPIIASESGILDAWEALNNPAAWDWQDRTPSQGVAPYLFLYGMFNSNFQNYVDEVYLWYAYGYHYESIYRLIKQHIKGGV